MFKWFWIQSTSASQKLGWYLNVSAWNKKLVQMYAWLECILSNNIGLLSFILCITWIVRRYTHLLSIHEYTSDTLCSRIQVTWNLEFFYIFKVSQSLTFSIKYKKCMVPRAGANLQTSAYQSDVNPLRHGVLLPLLVNMLYIKQPKLAKPLVMLQPLSIQPKWNNPTRDIAVFKKKKIVVYCVHMLKFIWYVITLYL